MLFFYRTSHQKNLKWQKADSKDFDKIKAESALHIGTLFMSGDPDTTPPELLHYQGDFWLDLDCDTIQEAISSIQKVKTTFIGLEVDLNQVGLFASGGKGFHVCIPENCMGAVALPELPAIHKNIAIALEEKSGATGIDLQLYCYGKGKTLRVENKLRENGHYKVPLLWDELEGLTEADYFKLCSNPRATWDLTPPAEIRNLCIMFNNAMSEVRRARVNAEPHINPDFIQALVDEDYNLPCKLQIMSGADLTKKKNASNNNKAQSMAMLQDLGLASQEDIEAYAVNNVTENNTEKELLTHVEAARNPKDPKDLGCGLMLYQTGVTKGECKDCRVYEYKNPPLEVAEDVPAPEEVTEGELDLLKHVPNDHIIKKLSLAVHYATQIPRSTTFLIGIGTFSSMACREYNVAYQYGGSIPVGLYVIAEQPSGTSKSRLINTFLNPFQAVYQKHREEVQNKLKGLDKKDVDAKAILDAALAVPLNITNATPEALEGSLCHTHGAFSADSSEQGLTNSLLGLSYTGEGRANNNDVLLNGFDGGFMASMRITRTGYSGCVAGSVVLAAQEGSVDSVLHQSNGTGLAERFLMIAEPHNLGKRDHLKSKQISPEAVEDYKNICERFALNIFNEPKPYKARNSLWINEEGWKAINIFRNEIEPLIVNGGRYSHSSLRGAVGKVDMQIMKLSANLQLLADLHPIEGLIKREYVESAIRIAADLLEVHLSLLNSKEFSGENAECAAVISYLSKKDAVINDLINSLRRTQPFKSMTGDKPEAIRATVAKMLESKKLKLCSVSKKYSLI